METRKKSLRIIGILLCVCAVVFGGVFYYLSNYNLKVWYSLQNEEIQQKVRNQMERFVKLSDEYWDLSLQQGEVWKKREELSDDLDSVYMSQARMAAQIAIQRTCTAAIKASEVFA